MWLSDGGKTLMIYLVVSTEYRRVTGKRTDVQTDRHLATALSALCIRVAWQKLSSLRYVQVKSSQDAFSNKKLSYRKQIARQLRTQYVEGIYVYSNSVTLKSRLGVTEGHWKRHHSIDHTLAGWVGCYICFFWYSEKGPGRTAAPPSLLLGVICDSPPINGYCTNFILFDVAVAL